MFYIFTSPGGKLPTVTNQQIFSGLPLLCARERNAMMPPKRFGVLRWKYRVLHLCFGKGLGISSVVQRTIFPGDASPTTASIQTLLKTHAFSPCVHRC